MKEAAKTPRVSGYVWGDLRWHKGNSCALLKTGTLEKRVSVNPTLKFWCLSLHKDIILYQSESEVAQWCLTLCKPINCSLPASSIHGIFQVRILEWVAISFSRSSSQPRDWTWVVGRFFTVWATRKSNTLPKRGVNSRLAKKSVRVFQ